MTRYISVVGPTEASAEDLASAREAGSLLASEGFVVVTGGRDGVMGAAATGVGEADGVSIGLLPGPRRQDGHPAHTFLLPTGLGEMRNGLVVRVADGILCIGGSWGTLSEVALAVRTGKPVVAVRGWDLPGEEILHAPDVPSAVAALVELLA